MLATAFTPPAALALNLSADVALIVIEQKASVPIHQLGIQAMSVIATSGVPMLALSQASASGNLSVVVPSSATRDAVAALQRHFWQDLHCGNIERLCAVQAVSMLTVHSANDIEAARQHIFERLAEHHLNLLLIAHTACSTTLIVEAAVAQVSAWLASCHLSATSCVMINKQ
jgi:hypothetical protein